MIIICEPQCKGISHEKFNSGFVYGLRLAFPNDQIIFYAEETHIKAIQSILIIDGITINNIEYRKINFQLTDSFAAFISYYFLFLRVFKNILAAGSDRLFILSFSPKILYIIKALKKAKAFSNLRFTLVLHGDFENIATDQYPPLLVPAPSPELSRELVVNRLRRMTPVKLFRVSFNLFRLFGKRISEKPGAVFNAQFPTRKMLLWRQSTDFKYLALSPHVLENAQKYIDVNALQITAIVLPAVFAKSAPAPDNSFVKFGVFGFGNPAMLREIASRLAVKKLQQPYEIRIIGMDNHGLESFPEITCPRPGHQLSRNEMEKYAADIDMFLILYDKSRYRLSCSGSILESLSYIKPILHFDNDCITFFDRPGRPIGITCKCIDEYVDVMADIVNHYQVYRTRLDEFRNNILQVRNEVGIENYVSRIRESFTW